jgi:hypothetical protein
MFIDVASTEDLEAADVDGAVGRLVIDLVMPRDDVPLRGRIAAEAFLRIERFELLVAQVGERLGVGETRPCFRDAAVAEQRRRLDVANVDCVGWRGLVVVDDPEALP